MSEVKNLGGQPPFYETPEELQKKIDEYLIYVQGKRDTKWITDSDENGNPKDKQIEFWVREPEPLTITGIALFLGFESRQSFYDYEKKEGFSYTIKRARTFIENSYEKNLTFARNPQGSIFALKNLGWADRIETDNKNRNINANVEVSEEEAKKISNSIMKDI